MAAGSPIRVMIVEDSAVVRHLLAHIIARDPRLSLVAAVATAEEALRELPRVRPDVISMDIRLPGMDGLEATRRIMAEQPTPIVVIASAGEGESLNLSMSALRAGALSVVEKPVGPDNSGYEEMAGHICTQLVIMSDVPLVRRRNIGASLAARLSAPPLPVQQPGAGRMRPAIMGIAASTGGPQALVRVLGALPPDFPLPILLVQHIGAPFVEGFARWLDGLLPLKVILAEEGAAPQPGHVHVAPGDHHLLVGPNRLLHLSRQPPVDGQRPAATVMFRSIAEVYGAAGLGVLLTGMGEDGARGLAALRGRGGTTITEDESTAVVYGMPAAAVRLGGSGQALPLPLIAPRLLRLAQGGVHAGADNA